MIYWYVIESLAFHILVVPLILKSIFPYINFLCIVCTVYPYIFVYTLFSSPPSSFSLYFLSFFLLSIFHFFLLACYSRRFFSLFFFLSLKTHFHMRNAHIWQTRTISHLVTSTFLSFTSIALYAAHTCDKFIVTNRVQWRRLHFIFLIFYFFSAFLFFIHFFILFMCIYSPFLSSLFCFSYFVLFVAVVVVAKRRRLRFGFFKWQTKEKRTRMNGINEFCK